MQNINDSDCLHNISTAHLQFGDFLLPLMSTVLLVLAISKNVQQPKARMKKGGGREGREGWRKKVRAAGEDGGKRV